MLSLTATLSPYTLQGKLTSNRTPGKAWGESMRMAGRKEKLNYLPPAIISVFSLFMCNLNGSLTVPVVTTTNTADNISKRCGI
uniref:Uncharacterized protein n=1 Tax=Glossina palpalis gambiensis TaxID=67801 RepID=A0A1B0C4R6_9MUSC